MLFCGGRTQRPKREVGVLPRISSVSLSETERGGGGDHSVSTPMYTVDYGVGVSTLTPPTVHTCRWDLCLP